VDPYNEDYVEECNKAFNLIISDEFPSYDSDQLPGASFLTDSGSYYSTSAADLSLDVTDLTHQVAQMEGIYNGATYFVGDNGVTSDGLCTPKSVTNLGQVRGLCPGEGGQEGSYNLAGLAYYGKTTDVRPDTASDPIGKAGKQDVTTYAISLGKGMPELDMTLGGQRVSVIPSCFNHKTGKPCTFVDMRISWQWQYGGGVIISWDEDQQGGDYDMDLIQYLNWEAWDNDGDTVYDSVRVYTSRWWLPDGYTATDTITFGYAITGVTGAGLYHDVILNTDPPLDLWSYDPVTFERVYVPDGTTDTCGDGWYDWEWPIGDCRSERYFAPGASTAQLLKSPLWLAAKYGGFEDIDEDGTPNLETEWDINSDGRPDTYFDASNIGKLEEQLEAAFSAILRRVTSGTAASVLASGEGSGANLVQAVYYPRRRFATREVKWLGSLQNLWYYVDPYFQNSTIREDTNKDGILDLSEDLIVHMFYDPTSGSTSAYLYEDNDGSGGPDPNYDSDGDGVDDTAVAVDVKEFAAMNTLWQAGNKLWARDAGTRAIYFYNGVTPVPYPLPLLNTGQTAAIESLMGLAGQTDKAGDVIRFTQGYELVFIDRDGDGDHDYRRRTADVDLNGDGDTLDAGERNEWKLGDIIDSTPRISSHLPLHFYDQTYGDDTYRYSDTYGYLNTDHYDRHGLVFTGANDGMLHAFRMGDLQMSDDPDWVFPAPTGHDIARLAGTDLGREEWAFIPMNVLPYLQYIAQDDYCHLISVDLSPYVFDASISRDPVDRQGNLQPAYCTDSNYWNCKKTENSWRTIVIGGLRFGGACRNRSEDCAGDDCTNVPVRTTVNGVANTDVGYSVYFALDVTHQYDALGNPQAPRLLWEFAHDELGVSSTGPAIVRINGWEDTNGNGVQDVGENEDNTGVTRNGRWLVVLGSGPTGPISPNDHQFLGKSDQNLKFFVLDLKSGQLLTTDGLGSPAPIDTGVSYGFAGSMINVTHDVGLENYEDEVLYVGYTYPITTGEWKWHKGGVGRIVTNGSADPDDWAWSVLIDGVGPVTAAPAKLENTRSQQIWVYFGEGRFFYKQLDQVDDMANQRSLYGVVDKCFSGGHFLAACSNADPTDDAGVKTLKTSLNDATVVGNATNDPDGWYIDMDAAVDLDPTTPELDIGAERDISDVVASTTGLVFFTTFTPYVSACTLGGKSFIWATDYATGGDPGARLLGKGLVQVSTGAIEEVDLKSAFTEKGGRRTGAMEGVPPTGGALNLQAPPTPEKRVIHVLEK
jgi:type IV pilus assembly protein PilY1